MAEFDIKNAWNHKSRGAMINKPRELKLKINQVHEKKTLEMTKF